MASRYGEMGRPRWDRESKSPPCICKNADTRTGQPRESEWWRWWASPRRDPARCHLPFSPSRQAITSSSARTASLTGTTGRASKTNCGSIEQNL